MKKTIVTTTIYPPRDAIKKFSKMEGWNLIIAGDTKTPHDEYKGINCIYLDPETQESLYPELSNAIGWRTIQRRNIAIAYAYKQGADIIALVDDDNIPLDNWGKDIIVGDTVKTIRIESDTGIVDPLHLYPKTDKFMWHRGFPHELLETRRNYTFKENERVRCLVQACAWLGSPDVDAIYRKVKPDEELLKGIPQRYSSSCFMPFNSQNTIIHRDIVPDYLVFPFVGRFDDIWGSYHVQHKFNKPFIVFTEPTVIQERNEHDICKDIEGELYGYRNNLRFIRGDYSVIPEKTRKVIEIYKRTLEE